MDPIAVTAALLRAQLPEVPIREGASMMARVASRGPTHAVIVIAGLPITAQLPPEIAAGATLRLRVKEITAGRVWMQIEPEQSPSGGEAGPARPPQPKPPAQSGAYGPPIRFPGASAQPGGSAAPAQPGAPGTPAQPGGTAAPAQPGGAAQPGQPAAAGAPAQPGGAAQPGQQTTAGTPAQPGSAAQPGQPAAAGTPAQPGGAAQPGPAGGNAGPAQPPVPGQPAQPGTTAPAPGAPAQSGQAPAPAQPEGTAPSAPKPEAAPSQPAQVVQPQVLAQPTLQMPFPPRVEVEEPPARRTGADGEPADVVSLTFTSPTLGKLDLRLELRGERLLAEVTTPAGRPHQVASNSSERLRANLEAVGLEATVNVRPRNTPLDLYA